MIKLMITINVIVLLIILIRTAGVLSRDLSESERAERAAFIQRLITKRKNLEGRLLLIGGPSRFEGNVSSIIHINDKYMQ